MGRPTNQELIDKLSAAIDVDAGTEAAVAAAQAAFPEMTVLEASLDAETGIAEVTLGVASPDAGVTPARLVEVTVAADGTVTSEERPDTAPGHGKTKAAEAKAKKAKA